MYAQNPAVATDGAVGAMIALHCLGSSTVPERHISTIYEKLGARGKVARATASAYAVRNGLS